MSDSPDEAVVARVLSGRRDDFGLLVDRYQDHMLAYVRYEGFDANDAADIVQDAFVRAYRHLGRCGEPERFAGWLFKIVRNLCHTARTRAGRRRTEPLEPHGRVLESDAPGPDERLEERRLQTRVRTALDQLPDDQREALILMYLQGCSVGEISELVGAKTSAVKMRLKRGREALKALLEASGMEGGRDPVPVPDARHGSSGAHVARPTTGGGPPRPGAIGAVDGGDASAGANRRVPGSSWTPTREGPTPERGAETP